jgi:tetratricopeptide (TPR) repeat protein/KaiC/GvpD/RAD55 family RecA-like ATPase
MDASQAENEYNWLDAANFYQETLRQRPTEKSSAATTWQKVGFCYSLASRQAKDVDDFKKLRTQATEAYEKAAKLFAEDSSLENRGKSAACLALAKYTCSWLPSDSSEKERMLSESCTFGKKALEAFKTAGDELNYGKTCNTLSLCLYDRLHMATTLEEKRKLLQEGIDNSNDAVAVFSKLENKDELLIALSMTSLQSWYYANISEQEEERNHLSKLSLNCSERAIAVSNEISNPYTKAMALWAGAFSTLFFTERIESSLKYAEEMLKLASVTRDNYFKGIAFYLLAHVTDWMVPGEVDPDRKKQRYEDIIRFAEDAIRHFQLVCRDSDTAETYLFFAESYSCLAREFAVKPVEKLAFSRKAVKIGETGLEYAVRSGSLDGKCSTLHALSKALHYQSYLEPKKDEKLELLRNALSHRKEYIRCAQKALASSFWVVGVGLVYAAQIEADLAGLEKDEKDKAALLAEAVTDMESGVSHCNGWIGTRDVPSLTAIVAGFEDAWGRILYERYSLTKQKENLTKANKIYANAAEKYKKINLPSRVAESYWKIAGNLDLSGDYKKAAENFESAFAGYKAAAQEFHQFNEFYLDYAAYMKAWSEIQTAKLAHNNGKYAAAMQHYERTSDLLNQSKLWSYLSSNFHAWSLLEQAEDLSRKDSCSEAISCFERSIKLFKESERTLRTQLNKIVKVDEKDLVVKLIEASITREEYGRGRIEIEEARLLDKQGDHATSSEKYEAAAATFEKILTSDSEQTRKEVKPLIYLCQAWQRMTLAETRSSPILYEEAAELFKLAKEHTLNEPASLLALAHGSFCKALEVGTEFEITRNPTMYTETKKHMDAAANYYLKAGFETASEYAKGTQRLFDAYVYMNNAKRETDPEKEAKYYLMAEKVLQLSTESYTKAKHPEKTNLVQRLLKKVREERELAVSLSEVFHAPAITSSTESFATISLSEEKAVGLERFEHADLQAKLIPHENEVRVGEDINLEIQIVNVGKEAVFLSRIENILPSGFQLVGKPEGTSFEDMHLALKGKRLDPLKTDEMRLSLRSFMKGTSEIKPRFICIDETGHQMLHEPESVTINVSEAVLPGRVTTGYEDLDSLLLGGIPENYAVVMTSPSSDERELLIKRFLETGAKAGHITFYIAAEPGVGRDLAERFQSNFYLFVCNPRAELMIKSLPNVFKLKGVESLTDIDIALTKSFRMLDAARTGPRRACIEIVSDVLLQHHAVITRKWLSGLLPDLRSKGFTALAVVNPHMHPQEEVQAILGLFEGEIRISEKETEKGIEKVLRIRKLYNQRYLENELTLTREKLES